MSKSAIKRKRKPRDPRFTALEVVRFKARPSDVVALNALMDKKQLDRTNICRLALHHLVEFEGLRSEVEKKANLLVQGRLAQVG